MSEKKNLKIKSEKHFEMNENNKTTWDITKAVFRVKFSWSVYTKKEERSQNNLLKFQLMALIKSEN